MKNRKPGLTWLTSSEKQRIWAIAYLGKQLNNKANKKNEEISESTKKLISNLDNRSTLEQLIHIGERLERDNYGPALINRMRNAWRQRAYSSSDKGRKAHLIKLPTETDKKLNEIAKSEKTNKTDIIIKLIEDSKNLHSNYTTALKIKEKIIKKLSTELKEEKAARRKTKEVAIALLTELSRKCAEAELITKGLSLLPPEKQKAELEAAIENYKNHLTKAINNASRFNVKMSDLNLGPLTLTIRLIN